MQEKFESLMVSDETSAITPESITPISPTAQTSPSSYVLTLLGTDTVFSPSMVPNAYDKAETLSYVATLIEGTRICKFTTEVPVTQFENVVVVDGPTTLGQEVGNRIAWGVYFALNAISQGTTHINIISHSRGAVEAIMVARELHRIQKLFKTPGFSDRLVLINTDECPYTKEAMGANEQFKSLNFKSIATHMNQVKVSMLSIDPVPGGNVLGFTGMTSLAWRNPNFYQLPAIVNEYEQYIYENERTRAFKPIVPKCNSNQTLFSLHSLPGMHGTGSGNLSCQQRKTPVTGSTDHVQELVLIKIIDFLTRNGVKLKPLNSLLDQSPFKAALLELCPHEAPLSKSVFNNMYLKLYQLILENRDAYRKFNSTSYPLLGQEQSVSRVVWKPTNQRFVHYQQQNNNTFLNALVTVLSGNQFINHDHETLIRNLEATLTRKRSAFERQFQSLFRKKNYFTFLQNDILDFIKAGETPEIEPAEVELNKVLIQLIKEMARFSATHPNRNAINTFLKKQKQMLPEQKNPTVTLTSVNCLIAEAIKNNENDNANTMGAALTKMDQELDEWVQQIPYFKTLNPSMDAVELERALTNQRKNINNLLEQIRLEQESLEEELLNQETLLLRKVNDLCHQYLAETAKKLKLDVAQGYPSLGENADSLLEKKYTFSRKLFDLTLNRGNGSSRRQITTLLSEHAQSSFMNDSSDPAFVQFISSIWALLKSVLSFGQAPRDYCGFWKPVKSAVLLANVTALIDPPSPKPFN